MLLGPGGNGLWPVNGEFSTAGGSDPGEALTCRNEDGITSLFPLAMHTIFIAQENWAVFTGGRWEGHVEEESVDLRKGVKPYTDKELPGPPTPPQDREPLQQTASSPTAHCSFS